MFSENSKFSLMRVMSFICFLVFIYVCIVKPDANIYTLCLLGGLSFFPKLVQKFAEAMIKKYSK